MIIGCGNPSSGDRLKQPDTLLPDTLYDNTILSYKDSVDMEAPSLKKVNNAIEGSSEGGEATLYLSGSEILKMNITFYGEMGKSVYVFYLRDGYPVFYIGTTSFYSEPIYVSKKVKIDGVSVDKIILHRNAIVSWLQNEVPVKDRYKEKEQEIRDIYNEVQVLK